MMVQRLTTAQERVIREAISFTEKDIRIKTGISIRLRFEGYSSNIVDKMISANDVVKVTLGYMGLTLDDVRTPNRKLEMVIARRIMILIVRRYFPNIYTIDIARMLNQDHTSVIHAIEKAEVQLVNDLSFREKHDVVLLSVGRWISKNNKNFKLKKVENGGSSKD